MSGEFGAMRRTRSWCYLVYRAAADRAWPRYLAAVLAAILLAAAPARGDYQASYFDPAADWLLRRTDPGGTLAFDPDTHRPPDLLEVTLGRWSPTNPQADLFVGAYAGQGLFLRLDVVLAGLHNPPGSTIPWQFEPFLYGLHPVFGFVEVDMDEDVGTGGELDTPQYRYLGNAVRFGGRPAAVEELLDRFALDATAFDGDFQTPPQVERSGEEFHLALLGDLFDPVDVLELAGDGDLTFEAGEEWQITAPWFHRAHGFEPFSFAEGGDRPGAYEPDCTLRFTHDPLADRTRIVLVFPLRNEGAAQMWGQPPESPDSDPSDQFSVEEALLDLEWSAQFLEEYPTGLPEEELIQGWADHEADHFLNPAAWRVQTLLGTSFDAAPPTEELFVWTDVYPNPIRGDVTGNGTADATDRDAIQDFILAHDADDGQTDNRVTLAGFPGDFSVFDINHDGACEQLDVFLVSAPGDLNGDGEVDLLDLAAVQNCFGGAGLPFSTGCGLADLDMDGDVDMNDIQRLVPLWSGPADKG